MGTGGNAAFIATPRGRTYRLPLGGRAFLHSYDWRKDEGFGVLQLIMTAPMVVASWINLQYYGSTVNNRVFGSGNKVLHNVVGQLGVLEGNASDLKVGLPWQSFHDGRRFVHEPLRLNVFIEAPQDAIDAVSNCMAKCATWSTMAGYTCSALMRPKGGSRAIWAACAGGWNRRSEPPWSADVSERR